MITEKNNMLKISGIAKETEKTTFLAVLTRGHLSKDLTADSNSVKVVQLFAKFSASITSSVVININLFLLINHI